MLFALLVFIVLLSIAVIVYVTAKTSSMYPYDVSRSYEYDFSESAAHLVELDLRNGRVSINGSNATGQSAFLGVSVATGFLGKYLQPSLEIKSDDLTVTQYFEHRAKGVRYLNISQFLCDREVEIRLEGKHVFIDDQIVQMVVFENQYAERPKVLVLAPHPDDAEIAAYGLYSDNSESYVVTVTAGEAGNYQYYELFENRSQHDLKYGQLRTWDSITVPLLGGVPPERSVNLGFFDGTLSAMFAEKSRAVGGLDSGISDIGTFRKLNVSSLCSGLSGDASWNSLVANLGHLLATIKPDIIVTPHPAVDRHPDHKLASIALFEALKGAGIRHGKLLLYINHYDLNVRYPHGKTGGSIPLPPMFSDRIYFNSIYSHPLSQDRQRDKLFALEAMHVLRPNTEWRTIKGALKMVKHRILKKLIRGDNSFYRRAIRSNELFFVVDVENLYNENILDRLTGQGRDADRL